MASHMVSQCMRQLLQYGTSVKSSYPEGQAGVCLLCCDPGGVHVLLVLRKQWAACLGTLVGTSIVG